MKSRGDGRSVCRNGWLYRNYYRSWVVRCSGRDRDWRRHGLGRGDLRWWVLVCTWRWRRRDRPVGWERNTVRGRSAAGMLNGTLGTAGDMSRRWWRGSESLRWWRRRNAIITVRSVRRWVVHSFVASVGNWWGRAVIVWSSGMEEHARRSILTHGEVPAGNGPGNLWWNVHRRGASWLRVATVLRGRPIL